MIVTEEHFAAPSGKTISFYNGFLWGRERPGRLLRRVYRGGNIETSNGSPMIDNDFVEYYEKLATTHSKSKS